MLKKKSLLDSLENEDSYLTAEKIISSSKTVKWNRIDQIVCFLPLLLTTFLYATYLLIDWLIGFYLRLFFKFLNF